MCSAILVGGCGEPAQVAGNYSINLTNKDNGCAFDSWTVGATTSGACC
jgi:hypothetical protein